MIYYPKIANIVDDTGFIPRKLAPNEELLAYRRYYIPEENLLFKVLDIFSINGYVYFEIRDSDDHYSIISPSQEDCTVYEFYPNDKYNIKKINNIINNGTYYNGYEILFWFYYNNIDFNDNRYKKFSPYIELRKLNTINPNKIYAIYASENKGVYYDIKFIGKKGGKANEFFKT